MTMALEFLALGLIVAHLSVRFVSKYFPNIMVRIATGVMVYNAKNMSASDVIRSSQAYTGNVAWVYFLVRDGVIVYVGQTSNLRKRLGHHAQHKDFDSYSVLRCDDRYVDIIEAHYIRKFDPPLNKHPGNYRRWRAIRGRELPAHDASNVECCVVGRSVYVNRHEWEKMQ